MNSYSVLASFAAQHPASLMEDNAVGERFKMTRCGQMWHPCNHVHGNVAIGRAGNRFQLSNAVEKVNEPSRAGRQTHPVQKAYAEILKYDENEARDNHG
jgi:hypothetical protein